MISVFRESGRSFMLPMSRSEYRECLARMLEVLELGKAHVELVLTDDESIARINREHMGVPGPTNVLSFPMSDEADPFAVDPELAESLEGLGETMESILEREEDMEDTDETYVIEHTSEASPVLGSLVLSLDTLRREAFLYGQDIKAHFLTLLAHGLVHLAGHEHGELMDLLTAKAANAARPLVMDS